MYGFVNEMSPEQKFMSTFITRIGSMTYSQAERILMQYFDCSPNQAERVLHSLKNKGVLTYDQHDKTYVQAGSQLVRAIAPVSPKVIDALWIAMDCIAENDDGIAAFNTIRRNNDNDGIFFISGDSAYITIPSSERELSKIAYAEQVYKSTNNNVISLFIFDSSCNKDYIMETLNASSYTMPHGLIFLLTNDRLSEPDYQIEET